MRQAYEGKVRVTRVARGEKLPISKLKTDDVFAYDTGFHVYLWVGKQVALGRYRQLSAAYRQL